MISFWRICSRRHAGDAFSGKGASLNGGRWNSVGVSMAYATENLSLAALELFVHVAERNEPSDLVAVHASLDLSSKVIEALKENLRRTLASDWQYRMDWTRRFGDGWIHSGESVLVPVPSTIIPEEWNLLLNPAHPDFASLKVIGSREFRFDRRMFKQKK